MEISELEYNKLYTSEMSNEIRQFLEIDDELQASKVNALLIDDNNLKITLSNENDVLSNIDVIKAGLNLDDDVTIEELRDAAKSSLVYTLANYFNDTYFSDEYSEYNLSYDDKISTLNQALDLTLNQYMDDLDKSIVNKDEFSITITEPLPVLKMILSYLGHTFTE